MDVYQQQECLDDICKQNNIIYSINKRETTAKVIGCSTEENEIFIPREINYNSMIYTVTSISEGSFCNSKVKSIQFPEDSLLQTIEYKAFCNSSIEKFTIPTSLVNLENGWCILAPSLKSITISPQNPRYLCLDNKFIVGKSKITSKSYDTIVFCLHDQENIKIPSFIDYIDKYSFCNCTILKTIEIQTLSNIHTTIKDVLKGTQIEIISTQQIEAYLLNPTKRRQETPEIVHFGEEKYAFQNYNYEGILYNCIYGKDRRIRERCRSQILVPYSIHSKLNWQGDVIVKNSIHSNHPNIQTARAPYFTEKQIMEQIEKIYLSTTPRCGRFKSFNLLLQYIKENTPPNVPLTHVSETFFNKIYFILEKQYQKNEEIEFFKNSRGENFELFTNNFIENETGQTMSISCFSSPFQLEMVGKSKIIGIDCTFRTSPQQYRQVMVIMGKTKKLNLPLAYILLPSKSEKIYKMALNAYRSYITNFADNVTFISDFELGEINAIKSVFMPEGCDFQLCYFHFVKAMKGFFAKDLENFLKTEEIQKKQNQDEQLEFNFQRKVEVKKNINKMLKKCAKIFPFIQHQKVYLAIEVFNSFSQTREFGKYFSETYLKRYSINDWSVIGKNQSSTITNNLVERHNRKLNETFDHPHPTLQEFKEKISQIENEYFNMYTNGDEHEETEYKHYTEDDFDAIFNELKNYLLNHVKQIQRIPHPQKEQNEDSDTISNIKDLPDSLLKVLKTSCQKFFSLPPHSIDRHLLLQSTEKAINNPNITYNKIRRWFNNNKEKYANYIPRDDSNNDD